MSYRPMEEYDKNKEENTIAPKQWENVFFRGIIILIFFVVICVSVFFYSPMSKIQEISISGINLTDEKLILQATRLEVGDSFLKVNTKSISNTIGKLKTVKSADVTFVFPNLIEVIIKEKKVVAYIYSFDNLLIPLLDDGTILLNYEAQAPYMNRPVISSYLQEQTLFNIANVLNNVPQEVLVGLSEIDIRDDGTTVIYTRNGYELRMFFNEMEDKLFIYRDIMEQLEYYGNGKGVINMFDAIWYVSYEDTEYDGIIN